MPKWLVEAALDECRKTLAGDNTMPLSERVRRMTAAFSQFGVTQAQLEKYVGHKLEEVNQDELVELLGVFNAIRDGAKVTDYFGTTESDAAKDITKAAIERAARKPRAIPAQPVTDAELQPQRQPEPAAAEVQPEPQAEPALAAADSQAGDYF